MRNMLTILLLAVTCCIALGTNGKAQHFCGGDSITHWKSGPSRAHLQRNSWGTQVESIFAKHLTSADKSNIRVLKATVLLLVNADGTTKLVSEHTDRTRIGKLKATLKRLGKLPAPPFVGMGIELSIKEEAIYVRAKWIGTKAQQSQI